MVIWVMETVALCSLFVELWLKLKVSFFMEQFVDTEEDHDQDRIKTKTKKLSTTLKEVFS